MKVLLIGAGGLGRIALDILRRRADMTPVGFISDHTAGGTMIEGLEVLGNGDAMARLSGLATGAIIAIGNAQHRHELAAKALEAGMELVTLVDPSATVSSQASIGAGVIIDAHAVVCTGAKIGDLCILRAGAIVEHDAVMERCSYVGPKCLLDARAVIKERAKVNGGQVVNQDQVVEA